MATISVTPIPDGSHAIRLWSGGQHGDPIDAVGVLLRSSESECEFAMAHGSLTRAMLRLIGKAAYGMGYRVLKFSRPKGSLSMRFAESVGDDEHLDYYRVDLAAEVRRFVEEERS